VANIKKTLKATHQQDMEEQMNIDLPSTTDKAGKKSAKTKGGSVSWLYRYGLIVV